MPTSAEVLVGANRHCPMPLFESDDRDLCLLKNAGLPSLHYGAGRPVERALARWYQRQ